MGAQPEPVEVLGVYAQKSAPANVVILGAGSFIWCGVGAALSLSLPLPRCCTSCLPSQRRPSRRVSTDYCQTMSAKPTPGGWKGSGIKSMKLHPWHDNWLLVLVKRPDCKNLDHAQTECPHDLFLTQV